MGYDRDKYQSLISLGLDYKTAIALADDNSPLANVPLPASDEANVEPKKAAKVNLVPRQADLAATISGINALITSLTAAGLMEE